MTGPVESSRVATAICVLEIFEAAGEIFLAAGPVRGLQGIICNLGSGDLKEAYTIWEFEIFLALAQSEGYWGTTTIWVHGFPSYLLSCHLCFCGNCFNLGSCVFLGRWPCKLAVALLLYSGCLKIFAGLLTFVGWLHRPALGSFSVLRHIVSGSEMTWLDSLIWVFLRAAARCEMNGIYLHVYGLP